MRYLLAFGIYILIIVVAAWVLALFAAWWIGMAVLTALVLLIAGKYLIEIAENYILD